MKRFLVALLGSTCCITIANAQIIVRHLGSSDPLSEGFVVLQGSAAQGTAVPDDSGTAAWHTTAAGPDFVLYSHGVSVSTGQSLAEVPWHLGFQVRLTDIPDDPGDFAVSVGILSGNQLFQMNLGMTEAGDPIIELPLELMFEGQDMVRRFEMTGAGSGYHHYILEYAPWTGTAIVAFDHAIIGTGYSGRGVFGDERVMFGGSGSGSANWNDVLLFVGVPEPVGGVRVAGLGLLGWVGVRVYRRFRGCAPLTEPRWGSG